MQANCGDANSKRQLWIKIDLRNLVKVTISRTMKESLKRKKNSAILVQNNDTSILKAYILLNLLINFCQ